MTDTINKPIKADPTDVARLVGISKDDADTVVNDIMPVLRRKLELVVVESGSSTIDMQKAKAIINDEVPKVLNNYALTELKNKQTFLIYIFQSLFGLPDQRAAKLVEKLTRKSTADLAAKLANQLGVHPSQIQKFNESVIPKIKEYSKSMLRKKLESSRKIENTQEYYQFIVDNVFIDEFENHPFIRSTTDAENRAILNPEALQTAFQMLGNWTREVTTESR